MLDAAVTIEDMASKGAARRWFWATAMLYLGALVLAALTLPARVPLHFDGNGVDRWGSRTEAIVSFGVVGLLIVGVFEGLVLLMRRISTGLINLPDKEWWTATPDREALMRRRLGEDMYVLGAMTFVLLGVMVASTISVATDDAPREPWWFWAALGLYLLSMVGWIVRMLAHRYRPVEGR